jgi:hypothetical protein
MSLFQLGINFIAATTVLPAMVSALGGSAVLVGLATGLTSGAWLLPQILVAAPVARLEYKKPLMVKAAWISRPLLLVLAAIIWQCGLRAPSVALVATLVIMAAIWALGGVVAVPGTTSWPGWCRRAGAATSWALPRSWAVSAASARPGRALCPQ